ncbi:hypothetical protein SAMCCGM7_pB0434 (plasmid) [Sinorhizobium americanum CCGM7]|nr:hypothetical protein SAMCCGM7_pB0434 [Sinorhizobium americanum CCGM7]
MPLPTSARSISAAVSDMFLRRIGRTIVPYGFPVGQLGSTNESRKM